MKTPGHRLQALEAALTPLACDCGNPPVAVVDSWYGGTTAPVVPPCTRCGKPETILVVEDPDWYDNDAHDKARLAGTPPAG
jgi:hypothetical protein